MAVRLKNVGKKFKSGGKVIWALRGVNLAVELGEIFGLLGPTGSGKTTLIDIILALLIPDEGEVRIFGKNPFIRKEVFRDLNFIPANRPFPNLKVEQFLNCYARFYSAPVGRPKLLLKELGLERLSRAVCWTLSTGEMTCVMLAKALLNSPRLLLLDEPMLGLDPKMRRMIEKILIDLNRKGMTIFFATHDTHTTEKLATKVAFIKDGKILDVGSKEGIVGKFGSIEKYWLKLGK